MDEKELKKLTRMELLELLVEQEKEVQRLKDMVAEQEARLADRSIKIRNAGSIAEAALSLNGVLEAANAAAQQYMDNVKSMYADQEAIIARKMEETDSRCLAQETATQERCAQLREEAETECAQLRQDTQNECEELRASTTAECSQMKSSAEADCAAMRQEISETFARLDEIQHQRITETEDKCAELLRQSEEKSAAMISKAEHDVENRWLTLAARLEAFYKAHSGLKELMSSTSDISSNGLIGR